MPSPFPASPAAQSTYRVSGPAEVLDAIPYLLGFHPGESLVLVGLRAGIVAVTARLDLADTRRAGLVEDTVAALGRNGVERLVAVVFDDRCEAPTTSFPGSRLFDSGHRVSGLPPSSGPLPVDQAADDWPWGGAICAVALAAAQAGAELAEAVLACRGRWWSYLCPSTQCCPGEGQPLIGTPTAFAAAATFDGVVALPDRLALAATLAPLPEPQRTALGPLFAAAEHAAVAAVLDDRGPAYERDLVRELLLAAQGSTVAQWQPPDDATAARFATGLTALAVRDPVWTTLDSRRLDGRPLWADLARRCPSPYDAAPLFLLAWANWRDGNGALAGMAAERALDSDPTYSAADLLLAALGHAVDPRTFPRLVDTGSGPRLRGRRRPVRQGGAARKPR